LASTTSGNGVKKASSSTASAFVIPDYIRDFKANSGSSSSSSGRPGSSSASLSTSTSASGATKKEEKSATVSVSAASGSDQNQSVVILQPRSQRQQHQQQQTAASVADNAVTSSISPQSFNVVSSDRSGGASSSSSSSEGEGDSGESGPTVVLQPRYSGNNANNRVSAGSQQQQQRGNNQRQQQQQQQQESLDESSFDEGETVAPQPIQQVQQQQQRVSNTSNKMQQQQQQQQQQQVNSVDSEYQQQHSPSPTTVFGSLGASNEVVRVGQRNYLRLACIGRGGSSRVYRVLGEDMNLYALKRVRLARMDHASVDVYKNEINLMKRLAGNRHIIKLMDAEVAYESRCIHMVMECGQADLNALLQSEQERAHTRMASEGTNARPSLMVDENQLRLVWQQMLEAVQTIHEARIVHGDLKPANFVFVEGVLKLIDFGIAKAISNDTTNIVRDSQVGTINYMSPEAIMDTSGGGKFPSSSSSRAPVLKQGRASDIWSLGCILYQMAYGKTPFADLSLIHKLHSICDPNYSIHFADCGSPALVQVLQSCLQRDPSKRPPILDSEGGGLLNHPFLRPHLSPHSSNQATRSAIEILSRCAPGEAVVLTREQLNKALILAGSLGAERAVAPFVAPSEVHVFVSEACARITDELLALGEPGAGTELPNGLQDELKAAARKPSSPVPAALLKATSLKSVNNGPINSNSTGSSSVTASSMTSTSTSSTRPQGSQASIPTPAVAVPNLQEAIASKAASLRHVDKENLVKSSSSSSSLGFNGDGGGGGGLLAAMRKGLNEKFAHARPVAAPGGDTSILDITGTWGMPT
jgi:serine/threonine protein kinase